MGADPQPEGADIAQNEPLSIDPLENTLGTKPLHAVLLERNPVRFERSRR